MSIHEADCFCSDCAYTKGVETMRAACMAAVKEVDGSRAVLIFRRNVLSALNEVQP
jgi:hypothetical protein